MNVFFQRLYFFLWGLPVFVVCMVLYTALILLSLTLIPSKKWGGKVAYFWLRCWGYSFSTVALIFYRKKISKAIDPSGTYIYSSNHNSFLDGINICISIPHDFRPLGKVELTKVPVFGWMYRYVVILVDRKSAESRLKSMKEMERHLKEGISVLVFPEGTMNITPHTLQEFKNGAFTLAIDTQTPIVPMVMINTRKCMPRKPKFTLRPGIITTYLLDPIATHGMTRNDTETLKRKVFQKMEEKLLEFE